MSSQNNKEVIALTLNGYELVSQQTIKYLGINNDDLAIANNEAAKVGAIVLRLIPNV